MWQGKWIQIDDERDELMGKVFHVINVVSLQWNAFDLRSACALNSFGRFWYKLHSHFGNWPTRETAIWHCTIEMHHRSWIRCTSLRTNFLQRPKQIPKVNITHALRRIPPSSRAQSSRRRNQSIVIDSLNCCPHFLSPFIEPPHNDKSNK